MAKYHCPLAAISAAHPILRKCHSRAFRDKWKNEGPKDQQEKKLRSRVVHCSSKGETSAAAPAQREWEKKQNNPGHYYEYCLHLILGR